MSTVTRAFSRGEKSCFIVALAMFTAVKDFATSNNALRRAPQPSASAKEEGVEGEPWLLLGPCTFHQTKSITMYLDAGFRLLVFNYSSSAAIPFRKIIFINEK